MNTSGFLTSLVTSFLIFLFLFLLHAWLSRIPANSVVFYPSKILHQLPLLPSPTTFSWISEAWSSTEQQIIRYAGIDAAVYLIFLSSALSICVYSALFCLPVLLPISRTDDYYEAERRIKSSLVFTNFDKMAMGNIRGGSKRLWAFFIGAYWVTIVTLVVLWRAYRHVVALRTSDQASAIAKPEQFTVLVRDIPPAVRGRTLAQEVDAFFKRLHPGTYERCMIVTNISRVLKVWRELESCKKNLVNAEAEFAELSIRPTHRTGLLGLIGPKVDSIEYYSERVEQLIPKLKEEQRLTLTYSQQGAALVFFNSRGAATSAAQVMHGQYANYWTVTPAPEPREIIWKNLPIPLVSRLVRQFAVYTIVFLTVFFYMIPIAFISAIISLDNLEKKFPFLKPLVTQSAINAILQAFLPQIVLILFLFFLPTLLLKLSEVEGIPARSHLVRAAAGKYFYFNVFNVFLGVTIAGTLFDSLNDLINRPKSIISLLSKSLPPQATFFITFVALQFFVGYGLALSRMVPLILYHLKRRYICKTQEQIQKAWFPGPFRYATCVPADMLIFTITLCYAVIAPTILLFAIVYFALGWLIKRNQALNVVVPSYESGGRMWPHIHSRILAALLLSQITMLGYFSVKEFPYSPLLIPLPVGTLIFGYICWRFYYPSFRFSPLVSACEEVKEMLSIDAIVEAYTPACLVVSAKDHHDRDPENVGN